MEVVPGQWWQKWLAGVFGIGTALLFIFRTDYGIPAFLVWAPAMLFVLFILLSIPVLYRKWMSFAEWLSVWITRGLFSIIYLVVVPFIWMFYKLSGRTGSTSETGTSLWLQKRKHDRSIEEMERMG
jgi:hypothetical protein